MSRLYLVRHGEAAAGWSDDADPGLSERGRSEAEAVAAKLARLGPMPIVVSPLRRCRETAEPLERDWGIEARVDPAVGEIESPTADLTARGAWLRTALSGTWTALGGAYPQWRSSVADALRALEIDTVVVSHFVAINAAVGVATGSDDVVCFRPVNCSCTVLDNDGGRLSVVELGDQGASVVR